MSTVSDLLRAGMKGIHNAKFKDRSVAFKEQRTENLDKYLRNFRNITNSPMPPTPAPRKAKSPPRVKNISRLEKLQKWQEERRKKKEAEKKNLKPIFKYVRVDQDEFYKMTGPNYQFSAPKGLKMPKKIAINLVPCTRVTRQTEKKIFGNLPLKTAASQRAKIDDKKVLGGPSSTNKIAPSVQCTTKNSKSEAKQKTEPKTEAGVGKFVRIKPEIAKNTSESDEPEAEVGKFVKIRPEVAKSTSKANVKLQAKSKKEETGKRKVDRIESKTVKNNQKIEPKKNINIKTHKNIENEKKLLENEKRGVIINENQSTSADDAKTPETRHRRKVYAKTPRNKQLFKMNSEDETEISPIEKEPEVQRPKRSKAASTLNENLENKEPHSIEQDAKKKKKTNEKNKEAMEEGNEEMSIPQLRKVYARTPRNKQLLKMNSEDETEISPIMKEPEVQRSTRSKPSSTVNENLENKVTNSIEQGAKSNKKTNDKNKKAMEEDNEEMSIPQLRKSTARTPRNKQLLKINSKDETMNDEDKTEMNPIEKTPKVQRPRRSKPANIVNEDNKILNSVEQDTKSTKKTIDKNKKATEVENERKSPKTKTPRSNRKRKINEQQLSSTTKSNDQSELSAVYPPEADESSPLNTTFTIESDAAKSVTPKVKENSIVYVSPYVTMSRGKKNAAKEFHERRSCGGLYSKSPESTGPEAAAAYFTKILHQEIDRIKKLCSEWGDVQMSKNVPEGADAMINVAIGQATLLLSKKMQKFNGLIEKSRSKSIEPKVTSDDLQGYWDTLNLVIADVDKRFDNLSSMQANNWEEIVPQVQRNDIAKTKGSKARVKPKKVVAQSKIKEAIEAARRKQRQPNTPRKSNGLFKNVLESTLNTSQRLKTPVGGRNSTLLRSVLSSEAKKILKSPGLAMMKATQAGKDIDATVHSPAKGCLKTPLSVVRKSKAVNFNETEMIFPSPEVLSNDDEEPLEEPSKIRRTSRKLSKVKLFVSN